MTTISTLQVDIDLATTRLQQQAKVAKERIRGIGQEAKSSSTHLERMTGARSQRNMGNFGFKAQQLGYQLQDIAVQAQGGASAFTILGQQGSQVASVFGPGGAVFGAVIALAAAVGGTLVKSFFNAGSEAEEMRKKIEGSLGKSVRVQIRETTKDIESQSNVIKQIRKELQELDDLPAPTTSVRGPNRQDALDKAANRRAKKRLDIFTELEDAEENLIRLKEYQVDLQDRLNKKNNPEQSIAATTITPDQSTTIIERLQQQLMTEEELIGDSYARRRELILEHTAAGSEARTELLNSNYDRFIEDYVSYLHKQDRATEASAKKRVALEAKAEKAMANQKRATVDAGLALLGTLAQGSKKAAQALLIVNTARSIAQAYQNTATAATAALAIDPTGAMSAKAWAYGKLQIGIIAANAALQFGSAGGSGGGGTDISSSTSTETPQVSSVLETSEESQQGVTIVFNGPVNGDPELIADALKDHITNTDFVLIESASRNGQELNG